MCAAAAAAKLLQLCPTLCDPTDGSPADSPVPGIHYILHINRHASPEYVLKAECKTLVEFIVVLIIVATTWMQLKCPLTNDWIKMYSIYTVKYYSAVKKKKRMD